eukprot:14411212-Alexandrium_andersonii.AAC.1
MPRPKSSGRGSGGPQPRATTSQHARTASPDTMEVGQSGSPTSLRAPTRQLVMPPRRGSPSH